MNAMLKKDIQTTMNIRNQYEIAEELNSESGKEAAREAYAEHVKQIRARGNNYYRVYNLSLDAMDRGNQYIDLNDCIHAKDVADLVESFRFAGLERFTYSSTWSSAVEIAWLFQQNGCKLVGMVEINGNSTDFETGEREKVPGFLFSL